MCMHGIRVKQGNCVHHVPNIREHKRKKMKKKKKKENSCIHKYVLIKTKIYFYSID